MSEIFKEIIIGVVALLVCCCLVRQRRYWREMQESRLSGSLRVGYRLAILTAFAGLPLACFANTESSWQLFASVMLMVLVFCVKITFSPTIIALTLTACAFQLYVNDEFPLWQVWFSVSSMLTWRLPDEIRAAYASISFLWVLVTLLSGTSAHAEAGGGEEAAVGIDETIASLHS
jgi:hypothetical protein